MFCSISGHVPEDPVVSKKSGHLFEKRLIEKYLEEEGKCPVTKEELAVEDLMPVQANRAVKPRPLEATSIPGLLGLFQNEWDDLMLETYTLKQHLDNTRQELSQALYQHDAACRVIARLVKERDAAREMLAAAQQGAAQSIAASGTGDNMETDENGLTAAMLSKMDETAKTLSKGRRKRPVSEALATPESIKDFSAQGSHTIHKSDKPGILCVDIHPTTQNLAVTGGVDKSAQLFDRESGKVLSSLSGHGKKVVDVKFHPTSSALITASADKTVKIWTPAGKKGHKAAHTISCHTDEVTGISLHATNDYCVTSSKDATWAFHDIHQGRTVTTITGEEGFSCIHFHPDGLILGTGTVDGKVRIWDVKEGKNVATFDDHDGSVNSICFSENGYHLAGAGEDGFVRLWDLRKLKNFQNLNLDNGPANAVSFNYSGKYLACASNSIQVYVVKQWDAPLVTLEAHSQAVTDVTWGSDALFLASTSMDRSLRFFA
jgi:pre-mRNA-processing factor 19